MSKLARLNRLFASDGKCLDVAIDHGIFNELSFLRGIEDIENAIQTIVDCKPDAIQLSVGQAELLQNIPGKDKPALVLRTDTANVYGTDLPAYLFAELIQNPVLQAVRLDAACVVVNLICNPGQPELYHQCIKNVALVKKDCDKYNMPLMVEPLVMKNNSQNGGYLVDGNINLILPLVRQAVELGADIIKADPCSDVKEFYRIVQTASGKPVLPRGGGVAAEHSVLINARELMNQGAKGLVYGRNIIQHHNPKKITNALMAIVHHEAGIDEAIQLLID